MAPDHDGKHPLIPTDNNSGSSAGRAVVRGRLIDWDPNTGLPMPVDRPVLSAPQIEALAATALSLPYVPEEPDKREFTNEKAYDLAVDKWRAEANRYAGMTCGEVMMVKLAQLAAQGNHSATEELLDRVLGKPKQSSEVKSVSMKYEDYLKKMAEDEAKHQARASAVDVEASTIPPPPGPPSDPDELRGIL